METEIYKIAMITCVIIDFGTHALLNGNWSVKPTKPIKRDDVSK
ncbi:hypothetical protein LCGC14_0869220 [marine sediment metagenome]|uniref:Uncharacterized protein n=1 Tax=marine sediment metagenome TaxID=412755 RepID=A0A0F9RPS9_9ZZZZ